MIFDGGRSRFEKIYQEHSGMVRAVLYNLAGPSALDDLTQEAFIRIWKGLSRFSSKSSIKTWIYRLTVNTAIDHLRRKSLRTEEFQDRHADLTSAGEQSRFENQSAIQVALRELDEAHRSVVVLCFLEELSISEAAEILNVPVGTVKSRLHTARRKMKNFLEGKEARDELG